MNIQKRRKSKKTKAQRTTKTRKSKKSQQDLLSMLKGAATTTFIWGLVIVNIFLIASFITGKISTNSQDRTASTKGIRDFTREINDDEDDTIKSEAPVEKIQVEVLNGCNVAGLAAQVTEYLRIKGFDVVYFGNYVSYDIDKSTVIDRRSMNKENAQKIAEVLGINRKGSVFAILSEEKELDVSIILGSDYKKLLGIKKPEK